MAEQPGERYAFLNLAKALSAGSKKRVRQWRDVIAGMKIGDLTVGSRTPVAGMPTWATPEVVRGGFATGGFAAGGGLLPHEIDLAEALSLPISDASQVRLALNNWHLTDEGLEKLRTQANSGEFAAQTPEETALLIIALLLQNKPEVVEEVLSEIAPFFDRLRFYPAPGNAQGVDGAFVRTVEEVREQLSGKRPRSQIVIQHNTLTRWVPLYDRLIDLLAEHGRQNWNYDVNEWLRDYERALSEPTAQRWKKESGQFQRGRRALIKLHRGDRVSQAELNNVQTIVARHRSRYGKAAARRAYRDSQLKQDVKVWHDAVAKVVATRLAVLPPDIGIAEPDAISGPIKLDEAIEGAPSGEKLPKSFTLGIRSARMAPIDELVQGGQIAAPEVLAKVLPQITSGIYANGLPTKAQIEVCRSLYRAFNNRRSLLLLNLESQVRLEELPWAQALLMSRDGGCDGQEVARQALTELVRLSLTHFPHVIFPNPLIQEFSVLSKLAGLELPFTNEIAADIFMGAFTAQFLKAANISLSYYADTLYARYYALPAPQRDLRLTEICTDRAGLSSTNNWSVASNGMILEQQQIITSHNLAQLLSVLDLHELSFSDMAQNCFVWIAKRQQTPLTDWRAKLQMTKNTAYAWRQMIAFMSELDSAQQYRTFTEIKMTAAEQSSEFQARFFPALSGLERAMAGDRALAPNQVFLGWVKGRHPFAP